MPDINYGAALEDAGYSATAGMMFGLPGGIVGGLMGFAIDVVPGLFPHLFGKNSARVQAEVKSAIADITGGKTNVSDVRAAIAADPGKADEISHRLTEVATKADEAQHQADLQQRQADLQQMKLAIAPTGSAPTGSARAQTADDAKGGSPIAWGAPVVSILVLITFAAVVLVAVCTKQESSPLLNVVLGTLGTMAYRGGHVLGRVERGERTENGATGEGAANSLTRCGRMRRRAPGDSARAALRGAPWVAPCPTRQPPHGPRKRFKGSARRDHTPIRKFAVPKSAVLWISEPPH